MDWLRITNNEVYKMIWLIGCKGMLGTEVGRQLSANNIACVGTDREVDITDYDMLENFATSHDSVANRTGLTASTGAIAGKITWVINCSAYTDVNKAETEPDLAKKLNEDGPKNIARAARHVGAKLIHISTDYVFDGTGNVPYTEDMPKQPIGVYGVTKAAGEDAVEKEMTQYYILRTAWLYGFDGHNFVYTMTKAMDSHPDVKVVQDQKGTPTCAVDLASVIIKIILTSSNAHGLFGKNSAIPYGIYHCTDIGETNWYAFTKKIYELGKKYKRITNECTINPCTTEEYPTPAKRPAYSVLSKDKLQKALRIKLPKWEDSLERFIKSDSFEIK